MCCVPGLHLFLLLVTTKQNKRGKNYDRDRVPRAHWAVNRRAPGSVKTLEKGITREPVKTTHRHPASPCSSQSFSPLLLLLLELYTRPRITKTSAYTGKRRTIYKLNRLGTSDRLIRSPRILHLHKQHKIPTVRGGPDEDLPKRRATPVKILNSAKSAINIPDSKDDSKLFSTQVRHLKLFTVC